MIQSPRIGSTTILPNYSMMSGQSYGKHIGAPKGFGFNNIWAEVLCPRFAHMWGMPANPIYMLVDERARQKYRKARIGA
jgi:hypothetical protein